MLSPKLNAPRFVKRYALAACPLLITLILWIAGRAVFEIAGCSWGPKSLICSGHPQWVWWLAALGGFWLPIVVWITAPISAFLLASTAIAHSQARFAEALEQLRS